MMARHPHDETRTNQLAGLHCCDATGQATTDMLRTRFEALKSCTLKFGTQRAIAQLFASPLCRMLWASILSV